MRLARHWVDIKKLSTTLSARVGTIMSPGSAIWSASALCVWSFRLTEAVTWPISRSSKTAPTNLSQTYVSNLCSKSSCRRFRRMWRTRCQLRGWTRKCRSRCTLIDDRHCSHRRGARNGADHHELFRQGRAFHVAAAHLLDRFRDDNDFARHRFARKKCDAACHPKRDRKAYAWGKRRTAG